MSATIKAIAIVAAIIIIALVIGAMVTMRRRELKRRFGTEYDRVVEEHHGQLKADSELADRERRVQGLDIRPLTTAARTGYARRWALLQEQFVDAPQDVAAAAQFLTMAVMSEQGYPAKNHDQIAADLSVEHASTLGHYRAAYHISQKAAAGQASTEDLRLAVIHYRVLFDDLLGEPADPEGSGTAPDQFFAADGTAVNAASDTGFSHSATAPTEPVKNKEEIRT
jgi:hypothetical protein